MIANQTTMIHRSTVHSCSMLAQKNGMMETVQAALTSCARKKIVCEFSLFIFIEFHIITDFLE